MTNKNKSNVASNVKTPVDSVHEWDMDLKENVDNPKTTPVSDGPKFSYIVGWRDPDSGEVSAFNNNGILFYGTKEDAEGLQKLAGTRGRDNYQIIKV